MTTAEKNGKTKDPVLVVVQLSGGNDFMNTVIPFTEGIYYDNRPLVGVPDDKSLPFTDTLAWHPAAAAFKHLRTRQDGDRSRRWNRARKSIAFQSDGHLAHLRA